jgi:hypothetical protein
MNEMTFQIIHGRPPQNRAARKSIAGRLMRGAKRRPTPRLGALLHERNRYKDRPPDFYALGVLYPSFRQ